MTPDERDRLAKEITDSARVIEIRSAHEPGGSTAWDQGYVAGLQSAAQLVREWPAEEPATPWIRVEDQLPEAGQKVLISTGWSSPDEPVIPGRFFRNPDGTWQFTSMAYGVFTVPPTHWQPLPPPAR